MQECPIVAASLSQESGAAPAFTVLVLPLGRKFTASADESLLQAAESAGLELPSSCRNGTCRSCICLRDSGHSRHLIEWPGLSPDEKAEGWILPCVAAAQSDLVLQVPGASVLFED